MSSKFPRPAPAAKTSLPAITGSVTTFATPAFGSELQTAEWPKETEAEAQAWKHAALGPVAQIIRSASVRPSRVKGVVGGERGARDVAWRTWDIETSEWVQELAGDWWVDAQTAYDRHLAADLETLLLSAIQCLQIAGRFVVVSYPVTETGAVRTWPVDEFGRDVEVMFGGAPVAKTDRHEPGLKDVFASVDHGLWRTVVCRAGAVSNTGTSGRWSIREHNRELKLPVWSFVKHVAKDRAGVGGVGPWVQTAVNDIVLLDVATKTLLSALRSQILAPIWLTPDDVNPKQVEQINPAWLGPGFQGDSDDMVNAVTVLSGAVSFMVENAIRLGNAGAQVAPIMVDIDSEFIDKFKQVLLAREIDPKLIETWTAAVEKVALAADSSSDAFFGAGSASGFNRNIGDTMTDEQVQDAETRAGWVLAELCEAFVRPYVLGEVDTRPQRGVTLVDALDVKVFADTTGLRPPAKLSVADSTALYEAGVLSVSGVAEALSLPTEWLVQDDDSGSVPVGFALPKPTTPTVEVPPEPTAEPATETPAPEPGQTAVVASAALPAGTEFVNALLVEQERFITAMQAVADASIEAAAHRLGSILRSKVKDPDRRALIASAANHDIPDILGPARVVAALSQTDADKQGELWGVALAAVLASWAKEAKRFFARVRRLMVKFGVAVDAAAAAVTLTDNTIDEAVTRGSAVLSAGLTGVYTTRFLTPAEEGTSNAKLERAIEGGVVAAGVEQTVIRATSAMGGANVDHETSTADVSLGAVLGVVLAGTVAQSGAKIIGYEWVYGPAERANPAPWHVANAGAGVVTTVDQFEGWVGDHDGCKCLPVRPVLG